MPKNDIELRHNPIFKKQIETVEPHAGKILLNWADLESQFKQTLGNHFNIKSAMPITGGEVNLAFHLVTNQQDLFVKLNTPSSIHMLQAEVKGLNSLRQCDQIQVPEPVLCGKTPQAAYLCMQWLEMAGNKKTTESQQALGEGLAALHQHTNTQFGFESNNYIGTSIQQNAWQDDWSVFFWSQRLEPQLLDLVQASSTFPDAALEPLKQAVLSILSREETTACLLHGDLWYGNVGVVDKATPCLFDPAVYWGDAQTDIAMTRLFGGFDSSFYDAYFANSNRVNADGSEEKSTIYQLYHLLNHHKLFGESYFDKCITHIHKIMSFSS